VTHPDVSRYFMTVQEAVRLVIQAGALDSSGEVLVLDMGEPVRIADVAKRFADAADRPIDIVYTGLRPGEKLQEVLFGPGEPDHRPNHPLISQAPVPPLDGTLLSLLDPAMPAEDLVAVLRWLADTPLSAHQQPINDRPVVAPPDEQPRQSEFTLRPGGQQ
jgi:FlaA1/EpsC-like NDP-sugar epimerase